jgi:transcriptional regulator GlxA family with amidase domain
MNFGILVFPNVEELDVFGPWEFLGAWNKFAKGPEGLIVAETTAPVICAKGVSINPHVSFEQCPALDFLLVPGGEGTRKEVENDILTSFIANQTKNFKAILSICTGSFLLHKAGDLWRYSISKSGGI